MIINKFMNTKEKVISIIQDSTTKPVTLADTYETLEMDSLDIVECIMALEEEFNLNISDEEASKAKTIADVIEMIEAKVPEQSYKVNYK